MTESITQDATYQLIAQWQSRMNLSQWRIRLTQKPPARANLMEISINRDRQRATIRISKEAKRKSVPEFQKLLIHELTHLILDGIFEEFEFQHKHNSTTVEHKERLLRKIEQTTEQLAHVFYNLTNTSVV